MRRCDGWLMARPQLFNFHRRIQALMGPILATIRPMSHPAFPFALPLLAYSARGNYCMGTLPARYLID